MLPLDFEVCRKARLSRDPRFDGTFFTAVKTTGIFCRSICPATPPKEINVTYFTTATEAASAGYRPCLRCRPDSAPGSPAWKGVNTTLERAIALINDGALQQHSLTELSERLGVSERYVRKLFNTHLGTSPKTYALYQQCLFAKQLLHQTQLPITEIALASGFNSVRRFNDCFKKQMQLTPSAIRRSAKNMSVNNGALHTLQLQLHYRPPYHWQHMQRFLRARAIPQLEWCTDNSYGRTFEWPSSYDSGSYGYFTAYHVADKHCFTVDISVNEVTHLKSIVNNIRRILDLDADTRRIENDLRAALFTEEKNIKKNTNKNTNERNITTAITLLEAGLRLPGIWSVYEAGIRAILGQQVSVTAAHRLVGTLVEVLGSGIDTEVDPGDENTSIKRLFPTPASLANNEIDFFKMPASRKQTLRNLSQHYLSQEGLTQRCVNLLQNDQPDDWQSLKGIGPWTINYAKLRGQSNPDIFLGGDLGIKKALELFDKPLATDNASPWRSYLTMHLWNMLY